MWTVIGVGTIWLSAVRVFTEHVEHSYHEELAVHVRELARLTRLDADGRPQLSRLLSDPRYEEPLSGFYWQVWAPGGKTLRSASMTRGSLDEDVAHSRNIVHLIETGPTGPAITYGLERGLPGGGDLHFVIATDKSELDRLIDGFTRELTLWLLVLAILLLGSGIALVHFGLRPLDRLGYAIGRLREGRADRLQGHYPAEIAPLVTDLNTYIDQNTQMIVRARVQAGNLAHGLRTPLAVITDEAERLAEHPDSSGSAKVLIDQAQMMEQQIEYQLARARFAAVARVPGQESVLPQLIMPILNAMRRLHPEKEFELDRHDTKDEVSLPVDPVDLSELLSILLDNAGKWASRKVIVSCQLTPETMSISISDDGPGMKPYQIARAFDVGSRFDEIAPGSGLGLAIAREIAEAIHADIRLSSTGSGLRAIVKFRARSSPPSCVPSEY
ncbi:sensor histidine kinase [Porphyrobacter algicida]|uniref:histidine kinase n=1 Tax=Qipengyuania algicida TaxID=1836209 RepID=A0A845ANG0_9SPHN|nr:sensor histidine kinase [Qipengyuania algicida]